MYRKDHLEGTDIDQKIILKLIVKKWDSMKWTRLM